MVCSPGSNHASEGVVCCCIIGFQSEGVYDMVDQMVLTEIDLQLSHTHCEHEASTCEVSHVYGSEQQDGSG